MKNSTFTKWGLMALMLFSLPFAVFAQSIGFGFSGAVTDDEGQPVAGAVIQLIGTQEATLSNADGKYELKGVARGGTYLLQASFIGFASSKQTVEVKEGNQTVDFKLGNDPLELTTVDVVGSSVLQERKQLGNTMTVVRADALERAGTGNAIQALQGKVAGAQISQNSGDPAGGISVRLRGAKSLLGSSEPLYVIDGVISNNGTVNLTNSNVDGGATSAIGQNRLADINPNDIESINVINGAAAAAIYGSRAANGVVLITTKRGKSGKMNVSFSTSYTVNELRKKSYMSVYGKQFHPNAITDPTAAGYLSPESQTLYPVAKGGNIALDSIVVFPSIVDVTRYDYQDQIFRQAAGTDNTLTVSGGSEKTRYYASINAYNNQGIINNTDFTRLSGRIRLDHQVNNWLSFSTGLTYANSKTNELPNGNVFFSPINSINITNNIFNLGALDASGNYQAVERLSRINPLDIINRIKNSQLTNRLLGNVEIKLTPIKDLVLTYTVGMDNANQLGRNYSPIYTYAVNPLYFNKGYVANNTATTLLINSDITAAYSKTFGKFSSNTVAGYNFQRSREQVTITEGRDLAPFVTTVNGATVVLPPRLSDVGSDVEGGFLQETFGYDNKAFLTLAGRVDASSRYPVDTRQNFYPKVGFSYIPSQEAYWDKLRDAIPAFKLRASWGQSGNLTGFGAFDRFNRFSTPSFNGVTAISANSSVADQNVKVEKNEELEFGADISLWKDFARVGVTYYKQTVNDLLLNVTTAPSQGGTSIKTNVGTLENKGLEITLGITAFKNSKANLEIFGTYSKNDNMVTKLPFGLTAISSPLGAPVFIMQGAPVGVFYGSFYARDASGNILNRSIKVNGVPTQLPQIERGAAQNVQTPLVYNGYRDANGQPVITGANSQAQRKIIGNPNPRNIWSAGLNFTYEKLTFSTLLDAVSGVEIFNADKRTRNNVGIGYISEQELKGEVPRGTVAALAGIEEFRIDDGSFVKLREMSLAYNFGKLFKGVSDVQLTVSGRNLISWDNYFGYDPETTSGGQSSVLRGTDFGNVPIPRSYNIALKANF